MVGTSTATAQTTKRSGTVSERRFSYTDRWGAEVEGEPSVERFLDLYDTIVEPDDAEHTVVAIASSDDWYLEASRDEVSCGQAEQGGEELGSLSITGRDDLAVIAQQLVDGDLEALRAHDWRPWA